MTYRYGIGHGIAEHLFEYFSTTKMRLYLEEVDADTDDYDDELCDECANNVMTKPITMEDGKFSYSFIESYIEVIGYGNIIRYTMDIMCKESELKFIITIDNFNSDTHGVIDCDIWSETPRNFLAYITEKSIMEYRLCCKKI